MEVKSWTLVAFIVLVICTWHTESVSRLDWLDSNKKSARPEEFVASSIDDDSNELNEANLQKLRANVKKTTKQHKSDTRSGKFQKKGPIFIQMEPPIPPAAVLPDGIVLDKVTYNPKDNEMWEIGSDVDDIERDESFRLNTDSITETENDRSQKSGSKKSKTSKKQEGADAKSKKTITEEPKTPNVNETPAPAATPTAPAPIATIAPTGPTAPTTPTVTPTVTPAPELPKNGGKDDGKEKKDNKSGGNPSNKKK